MGFIYTAEHMLRERIFIALVALAPACAMAQTHNIEGIWTNGTVTPFERPRELGNKEFFTAPEAAAYEKQARERNNADHRDGNSEADLAVGNDFWWDRGTRVVSTLRTSIIVDPPDGRIPSLTPEAQKKAAARAEARRLHPA